MDLPERVETVERTQKNHERTLQDHDRLLFELNFHLGELSKFARGLDTRLNRVFWAICLLVVVVLVSTDRFDEHIARLLGA